MKPHLICHMLSPLDGRLHVESWAKDGSTLYDAMLAEYGRLHTKFNADAWLAGTTTMTEFAKGNAPKDKTTKDKAAKAARRDAAPPRPWHLADPSARHFAIAIDRKARLHWDKPVADEGHVVVVLASSVSDDHLAELMDAGVSYLVMPGDDIDLTRMLNDLGQRLALKTVLLEGGARMNGAFLRAGLVDEISLLLCPAIDGTSGSPAIFEAGDDGFKDSVKLELMSADAVKAGAVHVRYKVVK
jgi:riboflavin biosynthesis pyrimidine reductase